MHMVGHHYKTVDQKVIAETSALEELSRMHRWLPGCLENAAVDSW